MNDLDEQLARALRAPNHLSEQKLESIRNEARKAFERHKSANSRWTIGLIIFGFALAAFWGWLFWQSQSTKVQIFSACALIGEILGVGLLGIAYLVIDNNITQRRERCELELRIVELKEHLIKN